MDESTTNNNDSRPQQATAPVDYPNLSSTTTRPQSRSLDFTNTEQDKTWLENCLIEVRRIRNLNPDNYYGICNFSNDFIPPEPSQEAVDGQRATGFEFNETQWREHWERRYKEQTFRVDIRRARDIYDKASNAMQDTESVVISITEAQVVEIDDTDKTIKHAFFRLEEMGPLPKSALEGDHRPSIEDQSVYRPDDGLKPPAKPIPDEVSQVYTELADSFRILWNTPYSADSPVWQRAFKAVGAANRECSAIAEKRKDTSTKYKILQYLLGSIIVSWQRFKGSNNDQVTIAIETFRWLCQLYSYPAQLWIPSEVEATSLPYNQRSTQLRDLLSEARLMERYRITNDQNSIATASDVPTGVIDRRLHLRPRKLGSAEEIFLKFGIFSGARAIGKGCYVFTNIGTQFTPVFIILRGSDLGLGVSKLIRDMIDRNPERFRSKPLKKTIMDNKGLHKEISLDFDDITECSGYLDSAQLPRAKATSKIERGSLEALILPTRILEERGKQRPSAWYLIGFKESLHRENEWVTRFEIVNIVGDITLQEWEQEAETSKRKNQDIIMQKLQMGKHPDGDRPLEDTGDQWLIEARMKQLSLNAPRKQNISGAARPDGNILISSTGNAVEHETDSDDDDAETTLQYPPPTEDSNNNTDITSTRAANTSSEARRVTRSTSRRGQS